MSRIPLERFSREGDDLAPGFDLVISGRDTSQATTLFDAIRPLIAGVTFEDDEEMSSLFELTVINQPKTAPGEPVDWRTVIDSKAFTEGNEIDLWLGYGAERIFVDRTQIVKWLPVFDEDGPGDFTIKGYDGRHRMDKGNQRKAKGKARKVFYKNMSDDFIVKKVASKYGYGADTDTPQVKKKAVKSAGGKVQHVFPTRVQGGDQTDWAFLQKLAQLNRFDLWVDWDRSKKQHVVHFKQRNEVQAAQYVFTYNGQDGSLIKATPDFSIHDQPTDVEVLVYDRKTRKIERTVVSEQKKSEAVTLDGSRVGPGLLQAKQTIIQGAAVRFRAAGQTLEAYSDKPFRSKKEAQAFVDNWLRERERDLIVMQCEVVGIGTLRSRQVHELKGMGARLDGLYRFTNVKHKMQPGEAYRCEVTAHKVLSEAISRKVTTATAQAA